MKRELGLIAVVAMLGVEQPPLTGRVVTPNGEALAGVRVCSTTWWCSLTDREGRFSHKPGFRGITTAHFSLAGFRPVSRPVGTAGGDIEVVLEPAENAVWRVPICVKPPKWRHWLGGRLRVTIPKGSKMVRVDDVDYTAGFVWYSKTEVLRIGGGPTWSSGLPDAGLLRTSTEVTERLLELPGPHDPEVVAIPGVDVRGVQTDGTRWRFTGDAFETFTYENASREAAAFFDGIIETLCQIVGEK